MFKFFKKEKHPAEWHMEQLMKWIIPQKVYDDVYTKLLEIQRNRRALIGYYISVNDFRELNKDIELTEEMYVRNIENELILIGDGLISEMKVVTTYKWVEGKDNLEFSAKNTDEGIEFEELDNGDLLIEFYKSKNKGEKYVTNSYKERIDCGNWKKKTETYWIKVDFTIDEVHRNAIKKAKELIKDYRNCKIDE